MVILRETRLFAKAKQPKEKTPTNKDLEKARNRSSEENKNIIETSNDDVEIAASTRIESQRNLEKL